jgi:hypothetical protein
MPSDVFENLWTKYGADGKVDKAEMADMMVGLKVFVSQLHTPDTDIAKYYDNPEFDFDIL